jgi:hypothetical protein
MNSFESFFLDKGLSYTLSKLLPYIIMPLIGLIVWLIVKRWFKKGWMRLATFVIFLAVPFVLYFSAHPIYEGDFANKAEEIERTGELAAIPATRLLVITIPDCPHCKASIGRMRAFKLRNPKASIEYRVCSKKISDINAYKAEAKGEFPVRLAKDPEALSKVAHGSFPTFVLIKKTSASLWSNDNFGVGALDEVSARFE